jgi:hypothetical protein
MCMEVDSRRISNPTEPLLFSLIPSAHPPLRPHVSIEHCKNSRKDFNQMLYLGVSLKILESFKLSFRLDMLNDTADLISR